MSLPWGTRIGREGYRFADQKRAGIRDHEWILCYGRDGLPIRFAEMQRDIDAAWRAFWHRRGLACPPSVSREFLGSFELPAST